MDTVDKFYLDYKELCEKLEQYNFGTAKVKYIFGDLSMFEARQFSDRLSEEPLDNHRWFMYWTLTKEALFRRGLNVMIGRKQLADIMKSIYSQVFGLHQR